MKSTTFLLTCIAVLTAQGYKIDPNLPDGTYFVPMTNSAKLKRTEPVYGEPVRLDDIASRNNHRDVTYGEPIRLDDAKTRRSTPESVLAERYTPLPISSRDCFHSTESRWDHEGSQNDLKKRCDSSEQVPAWSDGKSGILLSRYGSSIAYVCSWGGTNPCGSDEIDYAWKDISGTCGGDLAGGQACMSDWKKCYGHTTFTSSMCQNTI